MEVTFTKLSGRRYSVAVRRERGPALAPRQGPGYDDFLPHDAVHLIVESEARLAGGAFGRVAAGRNNIFWPADPALRRRQARREARRVTTKAEHADMARSEWFASVCPLLWELRTGRRAESDLPEWFSSGDASALPGPLTERIIERLDDFAARWAALPAGGTITLSWPGRPSESARRSPRAHGRHREEPVAERSAQLPHTVGD